MNNMTVMHGGSIEIDMVGGKTVVLKPATGNEWFNAWLDSGVLCTRRVYYNPPYATHPDGRIEIPCNPPYTHKAIEDWTRYYPLANVVEVRYRPSLQAPHFDP